MKTYRNINTNRVAISYYLFSIVRRGESQVYYLRKIFTKKLGDQLIYKKKTKFPVLDSIKKSRINSMDERKKITSVIIKKNKKIEKAEENSERTLSTDLKGVYPPTSINDFKSVFHFKPVAQFYTSTCWSFSATSFYESEIYRLFGEKIKLSEMWTAYYELIEKAAR